jgi:hypothetical protein
MTIGERPNKKNIPVGKKPIPREKGEGLKNIQNR